MFIKQFHRNLTNIQTFFDEKRALIDHNDYFFDVKTKMLKKIIRLRVIRLVNETHNVQSRVTFTHIVDTNFSIFSFNFVKFFFVINRKYIDEIFRNHFSMKNLHKLFNDYFAKQFLKENDVNEFKKLVHLFKCFEIYCQIVLKFVFSKIYRKLNFFITIYRLRLYTLLSTYIFDSMMIFHKIFVYARICENQNNSNDWFIVDQHIEQTHLIRRHIESFKLKNFIKNFFDWIVIFRSYCRSFNFFRFCTSCQYKHNCFYCQFIEHENKACFISTINRISISNSRRWLEIDFAISNSLRYISEDFFYELTIFNESSLDDSNFVNVINWRWLLKKHENRKFANALAKIFIFDVKIEYIESKQLTLIKNHFFVFNAFDIFTKNFHKQMKTHRIIRIQNIFQKFFISFSLNLVSKTNDDWKRIHDLLYSKRKCISINVFISKKRDTLKYIIFDEVVIVLIIMKKDAKLIKRDLIDAFKHVSIIKSNWWLLNFCWQSVYYFDRFLSFDFKISSYIFDFLIKDFNWIFIVVLNWFIVFHYLNDFFVVLFFEIDEIEYQRQFDELCDLLSFKINHKKNICDIIAEFFDIELNNIVMKIRFFQKKLLKTITLVTKIFRNTFITHSDFQSLIEFFSFAVKMMISNRAFFRRFFDVFKNDTHWHYITIVMKRNFQWWNDFLFSWNDVKILNKKKLEYHIWIDVSNRWDMNDYIFQNFNDFSSEMFFFRFSTRMLFKHINVKEMIVVFIVLRKWFSLLCDKHVILYCDNFVVIEKLKKRSFNDEIMISLRVICMLLIKNDIALSMQWIFTKSNALINMLFRNQYDKIADSYSQFQHFQNEENRSKNFSNLLTSVEKSLFFCTTI